MFEFFDLFLNDAEFFVWTSIFASFLVGMAIVAWFDLCGFGK